MATKSPKKSAAVPVVPSKTSLMKPGAGSTRVSTRLIVLYGGPKVQKTGSCSYIEGAKWVVTDPNCLGVETQFITSEGVQSFRDMIDGQQVIALTHEGRWQPAVARNYGKQPLFAVRVGRGRNEQTIRATANHRWLTEVEELTTAALRPHVKLHKPPIIIRDWAYDEAPEAEQRWWLQGFVFGDGARQMAHGREQGSKLRLCGAKGRFRTRIEELGFKCTTPDYADGEPCFHLPGLYKHLPQADVGVNNMTAFVRGWLDADGTKNTRHQPAQSEVNPFQGIFAVGKEGIAFIRRFFPMVGAYIVNEFDVTETEGGYGPYTDDAIYFSLLTGFSNSPVAPYNVREVGSASVPEDVWCLEVEGDQSFVLPSGVVTGNCIPTLDALDRLPPKEDIYEVGSLREARGVLLEMIECAEKNGAAALGCPAVVFDSATQTVDWHQQDVAKETGQRFMGDVKNNNGWQQFNAEFSALIDDLGTLSRYITVIVICHAKEKMDLSKGDWAGLNLPPQMALKMGRTANWVLYQTKRSYSPGEKDKPDEYVRISGEGSARKAVEVVIHTETNGVWLAAANARNLKPEEPGDMAALLRKEGLLA